MCLGKRFLNRFLTLMKIHLCSKRFREAARSRMGGTIMVTSRPIRFISAIRTSGFNGRFGGGDQITIQLTAQTLLG